MSEQNAASMVIQSGMAIQRVENDTLVQIAVAKPRDEEKIERALKNTILSFPEFAEEALYEFERGGKTIRGLSVVASREVARLWGNNTTRTSFIDQGDGSLIACGIFVDLETGRRSEKQVPVPRIVKRKKVAHRLSEDEYNMQARIEASKMERNATLDCLPVPLKNRIYDACVKSVDDAAAKGNEPVEKRWAKSQEHLKRYGISETQVLHYLKIESTDFLTHSAINRLGRALKAIGDGETSVAALFGVQQEQAPEGSSDQAPVSPQDAGVEVRERDSLQPALEGSLKLARIREIENALGTISDLVLRDAAMNKLLGTLDWTEVDKYSLEELSDAISRLPEILQQAKEAKAGDLFPKNAK